MTGQRTNPARDGQLADLAEHYFAAVDRKDLSATLACFVPDARITIATYDTVFEGRDHGIREMYVRLFARYASVWHGDFDHVPQAPDRVASRFQVRNVDLQGGVQVKNNCNFFRLRGDLFEEVFIYMSGDNSLR